MSAVYVSTLVLTCTASPNTGAQYNQVNDLDHEGLGNPDLYVDSATHNHTLSKLAHRRPLETKEQSGSNEQSEEPERINRPIYLPGRPGKCAGGTDGENTECGEEAKYYPITLLDFSHQTTDPRRIDIPLPDYTPRVSLRF